MAPVRLAGHCPLPAQRERCSQRPREWRISRLRSSNPFRRSGGLWLSGAAALFSVTAVLLVFQDWLFVEHPVEPVAQAPITIGVDAAARGAKPHLPHDGNDYCIQSIRLERDRLRYKVHFQHPPKRGIRHRPDQKIYFTARDRQLLGQMGRPTASNPEHVKELSFPVHTGAAFGQTGRIVALMTALLLTVQIDAGRLLRTQRR